MKRTYQGYAGGAPATPAPAVPGGAQPAYNYSAAPQQGYQPPLPPGPPPPQPQQQQYGQHQQYPGYGYGGQQQQQPPAQQQQPQQSYASYYQQHQPAAASAPPAAATQQPQYPGYGYGGGQAQQHQQAGQQQYPNYGYGGPPQQHQPKPAQPAYQSYQNQYPQSAPAAAAPYVPQTQHAPTPQPPQPYSQAPYAPQPSGPHHQPYNAYPTVPTPSGPGAPPLGPGGQPSPSGAPPYKRPRYDGGPTGPAPGPSYPPAALPPAVPPLAGLSTPTRGGAPSRGGRGGGYGPANRGGRGGAYGGHSPAQSASGDGYGYSSNDGYYDDRGPSGPGGFAGRGGGSFRGGPGRGGGPQGGPHRDFSGSSTVSNASNFRGGMSGGGGRGNGGVGGARGGRGGLPGGPASSGIGRFDGPKGPRLGVPPGGPRNPMSSPRGPAGGAGSSAGGGWKDRSGRGGRAAGGTRAGGRFDGRSGDRSGGGGGGSNARAGKGRSGWGRESKEFADKDKKEDNSKRTLTDFRISALEIDDLPWSWVAEVATEAGAETLDGVLDATAGSKATPAGVNGTAPSAATAVDGEKKKHGRDEDEDEEETVMKDVATAGGGTGKKKVKSEAAAEEAKRIDEAADLAAFVAAVAVPEASTDGEVKTETAPVKEEEEEEPESAEAAAARAVKELKVDDGDDEPPKDGDSVAEVKAALVPPPAAATNGEGAKTAPDVKVDGDPVDDAIKKAEAGSAAAAPSTSATEERPPHSYSKPAIPAGRENSRLRIYFASPSSGAVLDDGTDTHGHSRSNPGSSHPTGSKRKLSVSAESAMSVDTAKQPSPAPTAKGTKSAPVSKAPEEQSVPEEEPLDGAPMQAEPNGAAPGSSSDETVTYPPDPYPAAESSTTAAAGETETETENGAGAGSTVVASAAEGEEEAADDEEPPMPEPSPDRISISYARNTRRVVIDSDVVESIKIFRAEHKVEVSLRLRPALITTGKFRGDQDEYRICKGVLIESLDQEADDYVIIDRASLEATWQLEGQPETEPRDAGEDDVFPPLKHDPLLPPVHRLFKAALDGGGDASVGVQSGQGTFSKDKILIVARLDTVNPLTEAKWVRTGDVDSWISQMTGRVFHPEDEEECGWRRKITVTDPDPPPTIQHMLDTWLTTSNVGTIDTRQRFLDRHISKDADNVIEILLRIVRGTAVPHHPSAQSLITHQAATLRAPYPEQQTQVSLAVLGMYRLAVETAIEGGVPKEQVIKKATDIVRNLPYRMAFSALDGIYKDEQSS